MRMGWPTVSSLPTSCIRPRCNRVLVTPLQSTPRIASIWGRRNGLAVGDQSQRFKGGVGQSLGGLVTFELVYIRGQFRAR